MDLYLRLKFRTLQCILKFIGYSVHLISWSRAELLCGTCCKNAKTDKNRSNLVWSARCWRFAVQMEYVEIERSVRVCACARVLARMYVCVFNSSFLPCYCQIHIDIPRMSPESLVLQPKVTEVRVTEQTGLETQLNPPCSVRNKPHTHTHSQTVRQSSLDYFSWLSSSHCPASVWLPSDVSACLSCCSSVGQTLWNGVIMCQHTEHMQTHPGAHVHVHTHVEDNLCSPFQSTDPSLRLPSNQGNQSTNCSVTLSVPLCVAQISANLPVCFSVCFFSLSLSADSHWHTEN